jgi:hypothetical protein
MGQSSKIRSPYFSCYLLPTTRQPVQTQLSVIFLLYSVVISFLPESYHGAIHFPTLLSGRKR